MMLTLRFRISQIRRLPLEAILATQSCTPRLKILFTRLSRAKYLNCWELILEVLLVYSSVMVGLAFSARD